MPRYDAQDLEIRLKGIASIRINQKKRGDEKYKNDAGYWDGGQCNWGANHNLKEDCQKLAQFFTGIGELKNARDQLTDFNNQEQFERNKQNLLTKTNEAINGLKMKTSNNSSIAGVCIVWNDFAEQLNSIIDLFRGDVERLKRNIERMFYNEAKELQKLRIEERNLKREIEENERKARNEPDENKKKTFLFLVDQAKDQLKELLERKKSLKSSRLGDDFNPDTHIDNFLQELEKKLTPKDRTTRNPNRTTTNPNNYTGDNDNSVDEEEDVDNYSPFPNNEPFLKRYWKELLLSTAFSLGVYYIYNQPE